MIVPMFDIVVGSILSIMGLAFVLLGLRAVVRMARAFRLPTTRIAQLSMGPVEVEGCVSALGEPLTTIDGASAVAITTWIERWDPELPRPFPVRLAEFTSTAPTEIADDTGRCRVDWVDPVVMGLSRATSVVGSEVRNRFPELVAAALEADGSLGRWFQGGRELVLMQEYIPVNATVVLAAVADAVGARAGEGYRDAAPTFALRSAPPSRMYVRMVGGGGAEVGALHPAIFAMVGGGTALVAGVAEILLAVWARALVG